MAIFEILTAALAPTVGKILIKAYFGDTAADLGGSLMDVAAQKLRDRAEQRRVSLVG